MARTPFSPRGPLREELGCAAPRGAAGGGWPPPVRRSCGPAPAPARSDPPPSRRRRAAWEPGEYISASRCPRGAGVRGGPPEAKARSNSTEGTGYGMKKRGFGFLRRTVADTGTESQHRVAGVGRRRPVLETKAGEWRTISEAPEVPVTVGLAVELRAPGQSPPPAAPGRAVHRSCCYGYGSRFLPPPPAEGARPRRCGKERA